MDFSRASVYRNIKKGDRDGDKSNGSRWPGLDSRISENYLSAHPDIEVVATVEDGNHVLSSIPQTHPDLILMDIRMPGMDGVLATKEVKEHYPDIKIIILTTFDDDEFIYSALKYGASGYLLKGASTEELYEAIKVVYQGRSHDQPEYR